jgi:molybdate transport system substrate-binding protein
LLEAVENGIISKVATVNEVALQVDLGASDAGIVWDALIPQFKQSEFVRVPDFDQSPNQIQATISVLISSENKAEALKFARFLVASDKGAKVLRKHGFDVQAGDQWEE